METIGKGLYWASIGLYRLLQDRKRIQRGFMRTFFRVWILGCVAFGLSGIGV